MSDRNDALQAINRKRQRLTNLGLEVGPSPPLVYANHGGYYQEFPMGRSRARIYWHRSTGAHVVYGDLLEQYLALGGPDAHPRTRRRELGFPKADQRHTVDGYAIDRGRFEWGNVYDVHGGVGIWGDFHDQWQDQGGERGDLRYPVSEPVRIHPGDTEGTHAVYCESGVLLRSERGGTGRAVLKAPPLGKPDILQTTGNNGRLPIYINIRIRHRLWMDIDRNVDTLVDLYRSRLSLQPVGGGQRVPLEVTLGGLAEGISEDGTVNNPPLPNDNEAEPEPNEDRFDTRAWLKVELPAGAVLADRTLYDLVVEVPDRREPVVTWPHAFYARANWDDFNFLHATDIHVSRRIDGFRRALLSAGRRESAEEMVNWNDRFRDLIRKANRMHERGEIDFIMATGDLVDYIWEHGDHQRGGGNFAFFEKLVRGQSPYPDERPSLHEELKVPIFTTLGNHDYRPTPYELFFEVEWNGVGVKEMKQFSGLNITLEDAKALQGGRRKQVDASAAERSVKPTRPGWYFKRIGAEGSYTVELGSHRLVMIDTGPDKGVLQGIWEALKTKGGFVDEDRKTFVAGSPNSRGVSRGDNGQLRRALQAAGEDGLVIVGMHAPPLNPKGNKYPHYLRETEHPNADARETMMHLVRMSGFPSQGTWTLNGTPHFKTGTTNHLLDYGVARGEIEEFLRLCAGADGGRPVDLVLFGHIHKHVEYRLEWDARRREMRYLMDFYTENPASYYSSPKMEYSDPVLIQVKEGAPENKKPAQYRDRRQGAVWSEFHRLTVPGYATPLSDSSNPRQWWQEHRPVLMQTAPLGPMESNQRRDLTTNSAKPGPALQGVRWMQVENGVIQEIRRMPSSRLLTSRPFAPRATEYRDTRPPVGNGPPRPRTGTGSSSGGGAPRPRVRREPQDVDTPPLLKVDPTTGRIRRRAS